MHAALAASLCVVAMAGLAAAGTVTPVVGSTVFSYKMGCDLDELTSGGIGASDVEGLEPVWTKLVTLHPTKTFLADVPAGEYRLGIEVESTRVSSPTHDFGWRKHILLGGCVDEPHIETFVARGFGVARVCLWFLGPPPAAA